MKDLHTSADVVIAGAGFVGLALAAALARAGLDVVVCDPALAREPASDPRASTIIPGARHLLTSIGAWPAIAAEAQAVSRMDISDARLAEVARPVLLTFGDQTNEVAHVAPNVAIRAALFEAAEVAGVTLHAVPVARFRAEAARAVVELADGRILSCALAVAAEGAQSPLREIVGIRMQGWRYDQSAIVTTIALERDHEGVAVQHFLEGGPFALLPLPEQRASVVWAERRLQAERLFALPDDAFRDALQERAGHIFGAVTLAGPRAMRPLELRVADRFAAERLALVGDAAHVVHPIAGQGLNIGFRDVAALAECVIDAARLGGDIGGLDVLARYESWRRFDTMALLAATDSLLRLFLMPGPARMVRDAGMGAVERMPGVKHAVMRAAAGLSGEVPRLLRGEAL